MTLYDTRDRKSTKSCFSYLVFHSLLSVIAIVPVSATTFKAGVAQVDITPPSGLPMYGYFERIKNHQVASGTLDPLYARVLVMETGDRRAALVTLDLGRTFSEPWLDRLRSATQKNSRIDYLIVTASHTHSGPNILDEHPDDRTSEWQNVAFDKFFVPSSRRLDVWFRHVSASVTAQVTTKFTLGTIVVSCVPMAVSRCCGPIRPRFRPSPSTRLLPSFASMTELASHLRS